MKIIDVDAARTCLARLIQEALEGEEIVIVRDNQPMVRLAPVVSARPKRSVGWARGQVTMAPDFDASLDDFRIDIDNHLSKCAAAGPAGARRGAAG